MDRNNRAIVAFQNPSGSLSARRAWIEIPVLPSTPMAALSLSARRAWIEMIRFRALAGHQIVALRKESVDRNKMEPHIVPIGVGSLSARRAWIEIVDVNGVQGYRTCRSPQGERG